MVRVQYVSGGGTVQIQVPNNQNLQEDTTVVQVDTSVAPTTLILPEGLSLTNISLKIFVVDMTGNAAVNPITITRASSADNINGLSSVQVNTAEGSCWISGAGSLPTNRGSFSYIATFGGAGNSQSLSNGGYSTFITTLTNAQILNLANVEQKISPVPASGTYIIPIAIVSSFNGVAAYTGGGGSTTLLYLGSGTLATDAVTLPTGGQIVRNNNSLLSTDLLPGVALAVGVNSGSNPGGGSAENYLKITLLYNTGTI